MRVEMTATGALDGVGRVIFRQQQDLHFAHFEGAQHTAQASYTAPVASGLVEDFSHQVMPVLRERGSHHFLALLSYQRFGGAADLSPESSQQALLHIRMKVSGEVAPMAICTSDDQALEGSFLHYQFKKFSDALEACLFVQSWRLEVIARHPDPPNAPAGRLGDESVQ